MKQTFIAAAMLPLLFACQGATPDGYGKGQPGSLYISAMQPDIFGAEAEGGQGWVELKLAGAAPDGVWSVCVWDGISVVRMMTSDGFGALSWRTAGSMTLRIHPYAGYSGPDDGAASGAGWDGKFDFVCAASSGCGSLPAEGGLVWVEDGEGNVIDFMRYGEPSSVSAEGEAGRALASAVIAGEWPSSDSSVPCGGTSGYMRLSDISAEGDAPSQWMVSTGPSFVCAPHFEVSAVRAEPGTALKGDEVRLSLSALGAAGACVMSVTFDFSAIAVDDAHRGDAAPQTYAASADGSYCCVLRTEGILAGNYDVPVVVTGSGADQVTASAKIAVKEKPVIVLGSPVFSFAPSTEVAPGKKFTLAVPVSAAGTAVSKLRLSCAALGLDAEGSAGADGIAMFSLDSTGWAEGTFELVVTAAGDGAEVASASAALTVRSCRCVEGGDMETDIADPSALKPSSSAYASAAEFPTNVHSGERSLHISGTGSSNAYVFTSKLPCADKGGFSRIVFFLKGTASGKSLSVNLWTGGSSYRSFNLGTVNSDKSVAPSGSNSYTGSVYAPEWVKISLDISTVVPSGPIGLKFGASGVYDLYLDDIGYE